ncbi:hypothetical protein DYB32_000004 [Aphanomyces invadans]|uniref:3-methyl-2-oxobutanoate hydroxymethyltransferase n=1 Tax=Aphanomyces invadans TaxID=157072 RepID=A0A3R7AGS5_9STRA|nr:hypothetical protein DYB32_000004 [Aphanomyces invadans]
MLMGGLVRMLVDGGIAVMGHVGLRPQAISVLGGFRAQGRTGALFKSSNRTFILTQLKRERLPSCWNAYLRCVELVCTFGESNVLQVVAKAVTDILDVPTIGIGAGPHTSGQVHTSPLQI